MWVGSIPKLGFQKSMCELSMLEVLLGGELTGSLSSDGYSIFVKQALPSSHSDGIAGPSPVTASSYSIESN